MGMVGRSVCCTLANPGSGVPGSSRTGACSSNQPRAKASSRSRAAVETVGVTGLDTLRRSTRTESTHSGTPSRLPYAALNCDIADWRQIDRGGVGYIVWADLVRDLLYIMHRSSSSVSLHGVSVRLLHFFTEGWSSVCYLPAA